MLRSMTGYGKATVRRKGYRLTAEIRTLNGKHFDFEIRIPEKYSALEPALRTLLLKTLNRGRVELLVTVENSGRAAPHVIDPASFGRYYRQIRQLAQENGAPPPRDYLEILLRLPGVIGTGKERPSAEEGRILLRIVKEAAAKADSYRKREGAATEKELRTRIGRIRSHLSHIKKADGARISSIRDRITQKLNLLPQKAPIDQPRLEQELLYYLDKQDISEEISRTGIHARHFLDMMKKSEPNGKKLGFITQELLREINTIGNKSADATMQKRVVQMKDELEKIREQLANVL